MIIIIEAFRDDPGGEKMIITKKVMRMSKLEEVIIGLREAGSIWERGPRKKEKAPPQSGP